MFRSILFAGVLSIAVFVVPTNAASILNFTGQPQAGAVINQTYGDYLAGTPNVLSSYGPGANGGHLWDAGYGDLPQPVLTPYYENTNILTVTFTADPNYEVQLLGFDMGAYINTDYTIPYLKVSVDNVDVYNVTNFHVEGNGAADPDGDPNGHSDVNFVSLFGSTITIEFDGGVNAASVAIDNISIDQQAVPEPSSALLMIAGAAGLWLRRKRSYYA